MNLNTRKVLTWLKDRGKMIGLICNTGRAPGFTIRRFLEDKRVVDLFDIMLFSE